VKGKRLSRALAPLCASALAGSGLGAALAPGSAGAENPTSGHFLRILFSGGDSLLNYDSHTNWVGEPPSSDSDWSTMILFHNFADVPAIKAKMSGYSNQGDTKRLWMKDESWQDNTTRDQDNGMKNPEYNCDPSNDHMRLYADPYDDSMYNTYDGYYVIGTTHEDHYDAGGCGQPAWFGYSENAEARFVNFFSGLKYSVQHDVVGMGNSEAVRAENPAHIWQSDGYMSKVNFTG
jgi:hypothetical protein